VTFLGPLPFQRFILHREARIACSNEAGGCGIAIWYGHPSQTGLRSGARQSVSQDKGARRNL